MQHCFLFQVFDILGKKWTLFLLQEIAAEPGNGFNSMMRSLKGISPKILSARLKELEDHGLVEKTMLPEAQTHYQLTEKGNDVAQIIALMKRYVMKHTPSENNCMTRHCITCDVFNKTSLDGEES